MLKVAPILAAMMLSAVASSFSAMALPVSEGVESVPVEYARGYGGHDRPRPRRTKSGRIYRCVNGMAPRHHNHGRPSC
jgi:hypothetical protein